MGMGDAIFAHGPGLVAGGLHLFRSQLERARFAAYRQHRAGGDQLDEIGAAIDDRLDPRPRFSGPRTSPMRNSGPITVPGLAPVTAPPPPGW